MYIDNYTFEKDEFMDDPFRKGEYENCLFRGVDFSEIDFSESVFTDCRFEGCNLSMVKLHDTAFREVLFSDCKMLGLQFDECNKFGFFVRFERCQLNFSSFNGVKAKLTRFKECQLREVDFTECDLTECVMEECDLMGATFHYTTLEKADLRSAYNYTIDPETNRIRRAFFSRSGIEGLLYRYDLRIE